MSNNCLSQIEGCDAQNFTICEATLPADYHLRMSDLADSPDAQYAFHAAFVCKRLWDRGETLTYGFLRNSSACSMAYALPNTAVPAGKRLSFVLNDESDPLALEYSKKWVEANDDRERLQVQKDAVKAVLDRYATLMTLKFKYTDNVDEAKIKILFGGTLSSFAFVGNENLGNYESDGQNVNLGWFDIGTIIHEFGHVLGMIHEHQNPLGGISIEWDKDKVYKYFECSQGWTDDMINQQILDPFKKDGLTVNGTCFDPLSIMLYQYPSCLTKNGVGTKFNQRLSAYDVLWMHTLYGGETVHDLPTAVVRSTSKSPQEWYDSVYGEGSYQASLDLSNELRKEYTGQSCDYEASFMC